MPIITMVPNYDVKKKVTNMVIFTNKGDPKRQLVSCCHSNGTHDSYSMVDLCAGYMQTGR